MTGARHGLAAPSADRAARPGARPAAHPGIHPGAWWLWALALAVATTRTTNPLVLLGVLAAAVLVVLACRDDSPWARAFPAYLLLGASVVVVRLVFHVLLGTKSGPTVVLALPEVELPPWAAGIQLLGDLTAEGLLGSAYEGLRLAVLVVCVGAANALANPRRALRLLPASLHQVGTAVVIAVSVTPQLVQAALRVRRARRLRGHVEGRLRGLAASAVPVLEDALERSLALAAAMDSRGYARPVPGGSDRRVSALLLLALLGAATGTYGLLDGTSPEWLGLPVLLSGGACAVIGSWLAGRRTTRTRYRPDPWRAEEWLVTASGLVACALLVWTTATDPAAVDPSLSPLRWPELPAAAALAALAAALPALLAVPPRSAVPS